MVYRVIGVMSGSSLDGLDICYAHLHEVSGRWNYEIKFAQCHPYSEKWMEKLRSAITLSAEDYMLLHAEYGRYIGKHINRFIEENGLQYQVQLIGSHGHTTFHNPKRKMTAQLGDGASIAAATGINTVSDLRSMDIALGGEGAPIVPIGEKLLLGDHKYFLNLGGIANLSTNNFSGDNGSIKAYDVCPANRVLNLIINKIGKEYDDKGEMASKGKVDHDLLKELDSLDYYSLPEPKSLANDFGTDIVYPMIRSKGLSVEDALRTMVEHVVQQVNGGVRIEESGDRSQESGDRSQEPML
ncbi:MAG TPA: anhydro-N-acetylmuramic acid kinase, partial [Chitinophagaceae bacterium]|nr:anhydro-N-acetylmuramic acid kinase [Chitinophagaceae bacterium]